MLFRSAFSVCKKIRTPDLLVRSQTLYPAGLMARIVIFKMAEREGFDKQLHKEYIASIRSNVKDQLKRVKFVEDLTEEEKQKYLQKDKQ